MIRKLIPFCLVLVTYGLLIFMPAHAKAFDLFGSDVCSGNTAKNSPTCNSAKGQGSTVQQNPISGTNGTIKKAANVLALVGGAVAVITIIIAGISYTTAGGAATGQRAGDNPTRAREARVAIIGAVIGLIVIALAWTIVSYVTQHVLT